jgi:hypothetical protein
MIRFVNNLADVNSIFEQVREGPFGKGYASANLAAWPN